MLVKIDHVDDLYETSEVLREHHMKLNPFKCVVVVT